MSMRRDSAAFVFSKGCIVNGLLIIAVMASTGLVFGLLLALANKKLVVSEDPRIAEVEEVLPKGQCGACGYAGCLGYAEAVVKNPDVPTNLCAPGKDETAQKIAIITGKNPADTEQKIASIRCAGTFEKAHNIFEYRGIHGCVSANLLQGGNKACKYGCLGFGTCVKGCFFGALKMGPGGIPIVNPDKCTGCGRCETLCPKNIITLMERGSMVRINCSSLDRGASARRYCKVSCTGCGRCARQCPHHAIKIDNNCARIDESICISKCSDPLCLLGCPTQAFKPIVSGINLIELKANRWEHS
jgi:Na+-translocating ferredoxin:NAD+ oxidoreductase subunit B